MTRSPVIADASIVTAGILPDEDEVEAKALMEEVAKSGAVVPSLFWSELRNSLLVLERRQRISASDANEAIRTLRSLPLTTASERGDAEVLEVARKHDLTAYDAAYAALTISMNGRLATFDKALVAAGRTGAFALWQPTSTPPT